jgi:type IV fimbrial biogenesis protein FimT
MIDRIRAHTTPHCSNGFTLPELLITIAVASILLGVAVPSFSGLMMSNRLTTQANDLVGAINFARSEAIKRNRTLSLCRASSKSASSCVTSAGDWEHWLILTNGGDVVRRGRVETSGGSIEVTSTLTNDLATFGSDGLVRTGTAVVSNHEIVVCSSRGGDNNARRIVMGAGSRISTRVDTKDC